MEGVVLFFFKERDYETSNTLKSKLFSFFFLFWRVTEVAALGAAKVTLSVISGGCVLIRVIALARAWVQTDFLRAPTVPPPQAGALLPTSDHLGPSYLVNDKQRNQRFQVQLSKMLHHPVQGFGARLAIIRSQSVTRKA